MTIIKNNKVCILLSIKEREYLKSSQVKFKICLQKEGLISHQLLLRCFIPSLLYFTFVEVTSTTPLVSKL